MQQSRYWHFEKTEFSVDLKNVGKNKKIKKIKIILIQKLKK